MSTSYYPQGMRSLMSGQSANYSPWKSTASVQYGVAGGRTRPFTNKDPTNNLPAPFGRARPMKHYRKGRSIRTVQPDVVSDQLMNRQVTATRTGASVANTMDRPGATAFSVNADACTDCPGTRIVSSYLSNPTFITDNQTAEFRGQMSQMKDVGVCFNPEKKARNRCRPANTLLKSGYYTTLQGYRYGKCKTFNQRAFNFGENSVDDPHTFVANCAFGDEADDDNNKNCRRVVYKPNNNAFAVQGAVDSSLRTYGVGTVITSTTIVDPAKTFPCTLGKCPMPTTF
jgi:hypothetical protein